MTDSRFHGTPKPVELKTLLKGLPVEIAGDSSITINGVASLEKANAGDITCLHNNKYIDDLKNTKASACIVESKYKEHVPSTTIAIICDQPYRVYAQILHYLYPHQTPKGSISNYAFINPKAYIDPMAIIKPFVVLGENVTIGPRTVIGSNTVIEDNVTIGADCVIESNVTITHSLVGDRVFIEAGARIGQSGFGFHMDEKGFLTVPQLGRVIIEDDVHIGANTTIDRGAGPDTIIGRGSRLDNLVQIAHNVVLGPYCVIVAQVGIAGSTKLGQGVVLAGQVGIAGHLTIGDRAVVAAQSGIMKDIPAGATMGGTPGVPVKDWHRQTIALKNLIQKKESV